MQLAKTVLYLRKHADKLHIDTNRIILQGFSAGAHLAAKSRNFLKKSFLSEHLDTNPEMIKPNGMILSYPVITSGKFAHEGSFKCSAGRRMP